MENAKKILQITACAKGQYVNVYGLGDDGRVYTWDPTTPAWKPFKVTPKSERSNDWDGDRR